METSPEQPAAEENLIWESRDGSQVQRWLIRFHRMWIQVKLLWQLSVSGVEMDQGHLEENLKLWSLKYTYEVGKDF